jgi:hypothetical protein
VNYNDANTNPALTVETHSVGNIAVFKQGSSGTANVARISATGKGFFNGGTPGYAMRAPANPAVGTVIGKALQNFDQPRGSIKMLVMTR